MSVSRKIRACELKLKKLSGYVAIVRLMVFSWRFEKVGRRCQMEASVRILGDSKITLGERVSLRRGTIMGGGGQLFIGNGTTINEHVIIAATQFVSIGANCMLAPRVYILDVDHSFTTREIPIAHQGYVSKAVMIEDDVWIGTQSVILKGVTVGKGAIIGANSVVTHDVEPYTIVGGNPAKRIKERPL